MRPSKSRERVFLWLDPKSMSSATSLIPKIQDLWLGRALSEVANKVLHNVGNALISVNVSTSLSLETFSHSRVSGLPAADLPESLTKVPKGQTLPAFLEKLTEHLEEENTELRTEMEAATTTVSTRVSLRLGRCEGTSQLVATGQERAPHSH